MKTTILAGLLVFACISCKKEKKPPVDDPSNGNCAAALKDAESIAVFPADNPWNKDISMAPLEPYNDSIIARIAPNGMHADFGSGTWEGAPIGIPYVVVCGSQSKLPVIFRANDYDDNYGDESDAGPYPIPLNAAIEGNGNGDAHVLAVDKENGMLYELYNASVNNGKWEASSGAVFNLKSNQLRTEGWTSADAAGLPIFPGLVRYEEVLKGEIDHAIRFTLSKSNVKPAYIYPARHKVNSTGGQYSLPFGARLRLKSNYNVTAYPPRMQVILNAMKKYGLILADIGTNLYVSGAPDERWNNDELRLLKNLKGADFEVVKFNQ
jgi:hypothetical protein